VPRSRRVFWRRTAWYPYYRCHLHRTGLAERAMLLCAACRPCVVAAAWAVPLSFVDPPYGRAEAAALLEAWRSLRLIERPSTIFYEHDHPYHAPGGVWATVPPCHAASRLAAVRLYYRPEPLGTARPRQCGGEEPRFERIASTVASNPVTTPPRQIVKLLLPSSAAPSSAGAQVRSSVFTPNSGVDLVRRAIEGIARVRGGDSRSPWTLP